jgi:hypothetical protein
MSGSVAAFGFLRALDAIERRVVRDLKLESAPALGELTEVTGTWKGEPVRLRASAWEGPRVALFRTVRVISEQLEIVNVLGWARAPLAAPILGADLVAARPDAALVVADLSPLDPPGSSAADLPPWAQSIFSASPVFDRVTPETAAASAERVLDLAGRFVQAVQHASAAADPLQRDAAIERYRAAHLEDERMLSMLTRMFGAATAERLMHSVLFPRESSLDVHA